MSKGRRETQKIIEKIQDFEHKLGAKFADVPSDMQFNIKRYSFHSPSAYAGSTLGDDTMKAPSTRKSLDEEITSDHSQADEGTIESSSAWHVLDEEIASDHSQANEEL